MCVLLEVGREKVEGEIGYTLCAPGVADLSQVVGHDIIIWAEWDANNKEACGWSAGSLTFAVPSSGGDFLWRDNCLEQIEGGKLSHSLVKSRRCSVTGC